MMDVATALLLFGAGLLAGLVNAIAGGGTFITFGALSMVGVAPILANTTSSVSQLPGYVTSAVAYRAEIQARWRGALLLCLASAVGALAGARLLLTLDEPSFRALVPWLLVVATLLFAAGPWLRRGGAQTGEAGLEGMRERRGMSAVRAAMGPPIQLVTSVYGGFFGAGMGVMMLATLGLTQPNDYHRLNALKNLLSIVIAVIAIAVFVASGAVAWTHALIMIPGTALGGYAGVWTAKRLPQRVVRGVVIALGLGLAGHYFRLGA